MPKQKNFGRRVRRFWQGVDPVIDQLRAERLRRGQLQRHVADGLEVTRSFIGHAESGRSDATLAVLHDWAALFDADVRAVVDGFDAADVRCVAGALHRLACDVEHGEEWRPDDESEDAARAVLSALAASGWRRLVSDVVDLQRAPDVHQDPESDRIPPDTTGRESPGPAHDH